MDKHKGNANRAVTDQDLNRSDPRIPRISFRWGRCYELAFKGQMRAPNWTLVHGETSSPFDQNKNIRHAWLELDGTVYDPVVNEFFEIFQYRKLFRAKEAIRFTHQEAIARKFASAKYEYWGNEQRPDFD